MIITSKNVEVNSFNFDDLGFGNQRETIIIHINRNIIGLCIINKWCI